MPDTTQDTFVSPPSHDAAYSKEPLWHDPNKPIRHVVEMPGTLHPHTALAVAQFAAALAGKLDAAQTKYGYTNGWMNDEWLEECRVKLREHTDKGDPRDVAAYCLFLWFHGAPTKDENDGKE